MPALACGELRDHLAQHAQRAVDVLALAHPLTRRPALLHSLRTREVDEVEGAGADPPVLPVLDRQSDAQNEQRMRPRRGAVHVRLRSCPDLVPKVEQAHALTVGDHRFLGQVRHINAQLRVLVHIERLLPLHLRVEQILEGLVVDLQKRCGHAHLVGLGVAFFEEVGRQARNDTRIPFTAEHSVCLARAGLAIGEQARVVPRQRAAE
mmetsp:Transcript_3848/g.11180  ORF Transcript_3848/g.11180 Transcript_3848/m.11180 type:complete len:207 (+) Transcript_3848:84-704(+)